MPGLPDALLAADARLHAVHERYAFSEHLNPVNVEACKAEFLTAGREPAFEYRPLEGADDALAWLEATEVPDDHPLGGVVAGAIAETAACIRALRDRDAAAFDAWNERCGWYPTADDLAGPPPPDPDEPVPAATVAPETLRLTLLTALRERGWAWEVVYDPVMASRVLVDGTRRLVRVNPAARFRPADLVGLVAHEIDVHVCRSEYGRRQPLRVFATGLPGALLAEEGLAILAEARAGTLSASGVLGQRTMAEAIPVAREASFAELAAWLRPQVGRLGAWSVGLRLKRGLARPGLPGVYAKDGVYHVGYARVRRWIEANDPRWLFAGKVGLHHPVERWVGEGWIEPPPPTPAWLSPPG